MRFWHWFQWGGSTGGAPDRGVVQISVFDEGLSTWSEWTDVSGLFSGTSGTWTLNLVDLTPFSEELVKLAFLHQGSNSFNSGAGWFVDDVEVSGTAVPSAVFQGLQDFELGQGDWFADNGVWEVGTPTSGPSQCHQGSQCAGTILAGNYPFASSRLISPAMQLGEGSVLNPLFLKFWHWFQWGSATGGNPDQGVVQISVFDEILSEWSEWTTVGRAFLSSSSVWTLNLVDLTNFSGQIVRIGFRHEGSHSFNTGAGWFVDDISIGEGEGEVIFADGFE